jgi:hypothetical protein
MRSGNLPNSAIQAQPIACVFGAFLQPPIIPDIRHPYAFQKVLLQSNRNTFILGSKR